MSRQVRLDGQALELVEARMAAEGGWLSENANALLVELHAAVGRAVTGRPPYPAGSSAPIPASGGVPRTVAVSGPPSARRPVRARPTREEARPTVRAGKGAKCPHPILRRVGDQCAACGATVGSSRK